MEVARAIIYVISRWRRVMARVIAGPTSVSKMTIVIRRDGEKDYRVAYWVAA